MPKKKSLFSSVTERSVNKEIREIEDEEKAVSGKDEQETSFVRVLSIIFSVIAICFSLFHLYTAFNGMLVGMYKHKTVHLTFALVLIFLRSMMKKDRKPILIAYDFVLLCAALFAGVYMITQDASLSFRSGTVLPMDIIAGAVLVIVVLIAARRMVGNAICIVAVVMLIYCYVGPYLPSAIAHKGFSINRICSYMLLNSDGIFGVCMQVSSTIIILFVIFGAFLKETHGGDYFTELAYGSFGRVRGGPAKVAVVGSCLFGMVSGSAIANVVGTGMFTIPLMKKTGYSDTYSGAVEAVSSTGGQIMPPIMGASAFLIAEILGVGYLDVCAAALMPALLYYLALFMMIDLQAVKLGIKGLPKEELPSVKQVLKDGGHVLLAPVILLFLLIVVKWSAIYSAFWSIIALIVLSTLKKTTRLTFRGVLTALKNGASGALSVVAVCAVAGIIIGCFSLSGLGIKLASVLIALSHNKVLILLLLTAAASLVLGMGLPAVACYAVLAVLVAPALTKMGIYPMAAHMFIFYFGIISNITPPVAVAAYAAAGISGASPMKTGYKAFQLGIVGFIVPFMFVYGPELLFHGTVGNIILAVITSVIGVIAISMAMEGYMVTHLRIYERIALVAASVLLINVGLVSDFIGIGLIALVVLLQLLQAKKDKDNQIITVNADAEDAAKVEENAHVGE